MPPTRGSGATVALKVLPADMARDPDRLARFQREARAVAALDHPHIVTIHSVEESDGDPLSDDGAGRGPVARPADSGRVACRSSGSAIAAAIADALDRRARQGHRPPRSEAGQRDGDDDGRVKVLDFGLAKDARAPSGPADATLTQRRNRAAS